MSVAVLITRIRKEIVKENAWPLSVFRFLSRQERYICRMRLLCRKPHTLNLLYSYAS